MSCLEGPRQAVPDFLSGVERAVNDAKTMQPRVPGAIPADARNGGRVKTQDVAPEGFYRPNYNVLTPNMRSPDYVQMSTAAAITLGVMSGYMHRTSCTRCLNLLLTYPEGCRANCAYCGLARHREAERNYADRNFIRVDWPAVPYDQVIDIVANGGDGGRFHRMCISMITHPRSDDDTRVVLRKWTERIKHVPVSILSNPTTMTRQDVQELHDLGADIFTVALDACNPDVFDRTRGRGVQSPHSWDKYWDILRAAKEIFGPEKFGAHLIVGMGESDHDVLTQVQTIRDMGGHSHMFAFFPEKGSLMDHLPPVPRPQWRRIQVARYLIDYREHRLERMKFDEEGMLTDFGLPQDEIDDVIKAGTAFRTSGCPGKEAEDVSACDRPYGDLPRARHRVLSVQAQARRHSQSAPPARQGHAALSGVAVGGIMSGKPFRVIDTGVRGGRANIAFDQALIDARKANRIPDTVRFLRFKPSALIGIHQILSQEIKLDYCAANDIEVVRRITGGGGLYFDEGQIGWELVFDRATLGITELAEATRRICELAALGLNKIGVPARYRPRNDLEVDGRKISGTGGFFDGNLIFYQGTLLIDFDPAKMVACLNIPAEKLAKRALDSAAQRVVTMRELMGDKLPDLKTIYEGLLAGFAEGLGIAPQWGEITAYEEELADKALREEIGTDAYVTMIDQPTSDDATVSASFTGKGGTVRADIRLEGPQRNLIREALITGDFFVTPPRVIFDLEARLRGLEVDAVDKAIDDYFAHTPADFLSLGPDDIRKVVGMALTAP